MLPFLFDILHRWLFLELWADYMEIDGMNQIVYIWAHAISTEIHYTFAHIHLRFAEKT